MKKIYSIFIILGILILISNTAFATNYNEHKKIEEACKKVLNKYMQTFMIEETPEQDKIKDYAYLGYYLAKERENDDKVYVNIMLQVTHENKENTTWNKTTNYCFTSFTKVDGEYVLYKISRYPEKYDEFLERFEEYKKNNPITIESAQIQSEDMTNNLADQEIEKMSSFIFVSCLIIVFTMIGGIFTRVIKNIKK